MYGKVIEIPGWESSEFEPLCRGGQLMRHASAREVSSVTGVGADAAAPGWAMSATRGWHRGASASSLPLRINSLDGATTASGVGRFTAARAHRG